jgi:small neutral amino acid transporter SnatA (MarC family)
MSWDAAVDAVWIFLALSPIEAAAIYAWIEGNRRREGRFWPGLRLTAVVALALLGLAVFLGDELLEAMDISPENFEIAAGLLLALPAARMLLIRRLPGLVEGVREVNWSLLLVPLAFPVIASPAALGLGIVFEDRHGEEDAAVAAAVALGVVAVLMALAAYFGALRWARRLTWLSWVNGAALLVLAADMVVDGVRRV